LRDSLDARLEDLKLISAKEDKTLPGLFISLLPILVPLVLIIADTTITSITRAGSPVTSWYWLNQFSAAIKFLGDKNIAIAIGGALALWVMMKNKKQKEESLTPFVQAALMSGGGIILITAAGGAFGGMLQQSGISAKIAGMTSGYQMTLIPLAFFITAIVRTAQGSATVALITASGILSGMASQVDLPFNPVYIGLAIGCGAKLVPWMNDAGFWIFCKLTDLTEKEALKTVSPLLTVMGLTGLIVILIGAKLFPLI
jgi:gluconate:H+ symporter, GntP family